MTDAITTIATELAHAWAPILLALAVCFAAVTLSALGVRWAERHDERLRERAERRDEP